MDESKKRDSRILDFPVIVPKTRTSYIVGSKEDPFLGMDAETIEAYLHAMEKDD